MTNPTSKRFSCPRHWSLAQRLAHYSASPDERGCILWTGATKVDGYGFLNWQRKMQKTHRLAWFSVNGPIPNGLHVLHRCDVPGCINVSHLFLGTNADNVADMIAKGRHALYRKGEHPRARLTDDDVRAIRIDTRDTRDIATAYSVSQSHIRAIKCGVRRGDVGSD